MFYHTAEGKINQPVRLKIANGNSNKNLLTLYYPQETDKPTYVWPSILAIALN